MATFLQTAFSTFGAGNVGAISKSTLEDLGTTAWITNGVDTSGISVIETEGADDDKIQKLSIDTFDVLRFEISANQNPCCFNNRSHINIEWTGEQSEVWGQYHIKFLSTFNPEKGGMLPIWVSSETNPFSGENPQTNDSFGSMLAWRGQGFDDEQATDGSIINSTLGANEFELSTFSYSEDSINLSNNPFGDSKFFKNLTTKVRSTYTHNVWYKVDFRYKLNDANQNNGIQQVWIDGTLVHDVQDYNWRNGTNGFKRLGLIFSPFGVDSSWESSTVRYVAIRDVTLSDTALISPKTQLESIPGFQIDCNNNGLTTLELSWDTVDSGSTNIVIERSIDQFSWSTIATLANTATSYSDASIDTNTIYYYRARLTGSPANSQYTRIVSCKTSENPTTPVTPINLSVNCVDATSSIISWNYTDHDPDVEIVIERSPNGTTFSEIDTVNTALQQDDYYNVGLTASTQYWWRIFARNTVSSNVSTTVGPVNCTTPALATGTPPAPCVLQYFHSVNGWTNITSTGTVTLTGLTRAVVNGLKFRYDCGTNCSKTYHTVDWNAPIGNNLRVNVTGTSLLLNMSGYRNTTSQNNQNADNINTLTIITQPDNGTASIPASTDNILYTPNTNFNGIDKLVYRYKNGLEEDSSYGTITYYVTNPNQGTSVMTINKASITGISITTTASHLGNAGSPTGSSSGFHKFLFTLENGSTRPSFTVTKQVGTTWSATEISQFETLGLFGVTGTFAGIISSITKNPNAIDTLAYPISVQHQYANSATGYFANTSTSTICQYGRLAWDDSSDTTTEAVSAKNTPTKLAGGISYVSAALSNIYVTDKYDISAVTSGSWRVTEYNLPCIAYASGLTDALTISSTITLREAIQTYVAGKTGMSFSYDTGTSGGYLANVHHIGNLSYSSAWACNCDNYTDTYYIIIQDASSSEFFRIDMTMNEINKR